MLPIPVPATKEAAVLHRRQPWVFFYDETFDGDGLKIKEILEKGPLDLTSGKIKPGMIIRKINNQEIKKGQDYFQILEGLSVNG